jgi:hypothetical protein
MRPTFLSFKWLLCGLVLVLFPCWLWAQPGGYYDTVDDASPQTLRTSLHEIIDDHQRFPYTSSQTDTWDVLEIADQNPENGGEVITIYRNTGFPKQGGGNDFYNREHTWPNSYGFPDNDSSVNYPFTGMHALFLSDVDYNFARSNHPYNYCDANCVEYGTVGNNGRFFPGKSKSIY